MKYLPFELHTHTQHSDGDFIVSELIENAKKAGLAGIALTDHNTYSGYNEASDEGKKLEVLVIPGIEWTTFYGHLTVLGGSASNDWRVVSPATIKENVLSARKSGACIGVAHPTRVGYPICTGGWDDFLLKPSEYGIFTHYEVWSYLNPSVQHANLLSERKYASICEENIRLACVYGRDWHRGDSNVVYAATYLGIQGDLSIDNALDAIRNGRTYISCGLHAIFVLNDTNGVEYNVGARVRAGEYRFSGKISYFSDYYTKLNSIEYMEISLIGNGGNYTVPINKDGFFEFNLKCKEKKYLQPVVYGNVKGIYSKLLLATPYFFE
ncbi:MAG: CehA/McbA family metallohydrolase [Christensenellaceae bacterium]|jgi:hypothetical protein|nr:CehA/McbA family metallohydrolase [Christensenellaceae bacterium]